MTDPPPAPGPDGPAAERARFEFDAAPYLLGGLDDTERAAFEQHLLGCASCQDSLTELSALPPLMARADVTGWQPEAPPDTLLPRLLRQVAASRRRRAWRPIAAGIAAACVAALLLVAGTVTWQHTHQPRALLMQAVGANPEAVRATVVLTRSGSGTRIQLDCGYRGAASYPDGSAPSYRMVVFNRLGQMRDLGSWTPQPGEDVRIARDSPWSRQNLSRIEVSDDRGTPLLRLTL